MSHLSVRNISEARDYFSEDRKLFADLDDPFARHHVDMLTLAILECDAQIRDRRCAEDVAGQASHARGPR